MPTRIAVISDIHANLHALEAVLAAIDVDGVDELWCLGDIVGYGPRPNECIALVRERAAVCLAGNHDLVVARQDRERGVRRRGCGRCPLDDWCARARRARVPRLARAARRGRGRAALPRQPDRSDLGLRADRAGGAAQLRRDLRPARARRAQPHRARDRVRGRGELYGGQAPEGTELVLGADRLLLNPGSVGQPRDGDPRAAGSRLTKAPSGHGSAEPATRSSRRKRRCESGACPRPSPRGSRTGSSSARPKGEKMAELTNWRRSSAR